MEYASEHYVNACIAALLWASQYKTTDAYNICIMHFLVNGLRESGHHCMASVLGDKKHEAKPSRLLLYALKSCLEAHPRDVEVFSGDVENCPDDDEDMKIIHVQARWDPQAARQLLQ